MGGPQFRHAPVDEAFEELEGLRSAKPDAFRAFFARWYGCVHHFALEATPGFADARRLTRAVLRRLVEEAGDVHDPDDLARLVFTIAREEAGRRPNV